MRLPVSVTGCSSASIFNLFLNWFSDFIDSLQLIKQNHTHKFIHSESSHYDFCTLLSFSVSSWFRSFKLIISSILSSICSLRTFSSLSRSLFSFYWGLYCSSYIFASPFSFPILNSRFSILSFFSPIIFPWSQFCWSSFSICFWRFPVYFSRFLISFCWSSSCFLCPFCWSSSCFLCP